MIQHITFATENMSISAEKCHYSVIKHGAFQSCVFNLQDISPDFLKLNREIFSQERGAGYWLWKPYIIYHKLLDMQDGDYLIYSDAGVEFVAPVTEVINRMNQDIFLFGNEWDHGNFCKWDVIMRMGAYSATKQVQASVIFIRNSNFSRLFIKEWLLWCQMPDFIDDTSMGTESSDFIEHRHDQAILTNLAYRYDIKLHRWATQYDNPRYHELYPNDTYGQLFNHHGLRNNGQRH